MRQLEGTVFGDENAGKAKTGGKKKRDEAEKGKSSY
jgi:hypothetical protein